MEIEVNYIAVILGAVLSMALGFLWYSPYLFGKAWMKLMGYTQESLKKAQKEMGPMYGVSFVATLATGFVLAHMMEISEDFYDTSMMMTGITTAFWVWLGFILPVQLTEVLFGGKKWKLFAINTGYQLASVIVLGIVIALFD